MFGPIYRDFDFTGGHRDKAKFKRVHESHSSDVWKPLRTEYYSRPNGVDPPANINVTALIFPENPVFGEVRLVVAFT